MKVKQINQANQFYQNQSYIKSSFSSFLLDTDHPKLKFVLIAPLPSVETLFNSEENTSGRTLDVEGLVVVGSFVWTA